ncbi:cytochrome c oxidase assembly protein [Nocardia sp. IBHARD005]|uniref:cytochrome c oxidase assembly protein n=1 Tax=Nocardia sp. IBHARD005 TaxID=3457765 RepID=UPI0040585681
MKTAVMSRRAERPGAVVLATVLVFVVVGAAADFPYLAAGTAYPGMVQAWMYGGLRIVAMVAGAVTLGALVYVVSCTETGAYGRVGVDGYAGIRLVERTGVVWALAATALVPVSAADIGGMSTSEMLARGALGALIDAGDKPKAWLVVAVFATAVAALARLVLSWNGAVGLAVLAGIAVLPPVVVGNAGEGPGHDYATGAVILFQLAISVPVGLLWCVRDHLTRRGLHRAAVLRRTRLLVAMCLLVAAVCAVVLAVLFVPAAALLGTGYGRLAVGGTVLLGVVGVSVVWRGTSVALGGAAALVAVVLFALAGMRPAPAFAGRQFTAHEAFIGFDVPVPPTGWQLLTFWRFDVVLGGAAVVGALFYCAGVVRLRRRGDAWSRWRGLSWLAGCGVLLMATSSGIGAYGYAMFSLHMITHMALNMVVPVLLVLGAPVTLLLRVVPPAGRDGLRGVREGVLAVLHSRPTAVFAHPGFSISAFVVSLYGLYFTSLFEALNRYHWGHLLMNMHFLLVGYLFYWAIIGIDPGPRRLPHLGRLGMLFAIMPFHAFFGVAVMSMTTVIGERFYTNLQLPWGIDLLADQRAGGGIAWVAGEVPVLIVVGALLSQWVAQDRRTAVRTDRKDDTYGDSDLDAYNAMLAELTRTRR